MSDPKILVWDIETTHLKADFGTILCIGYGWLDEGDPKVISIMDYRGWRRDPTNDSRLVKDFLPILKDADMWVTYYGKGFDLPYINSKCLEYNLPVLPNTPHVDLYFTVKHHLNLSRKSLANVAQYIQLGEKTPVSGRLWKQAMTGDQEAITYIVTHCKADVELTTAAYLRLRPLVRTHPRVMGYGPCAMCGSQRVIREKQRLTRTKGLRWQYRCKECGSYDTRGE